MSHFVQGVTQITKTASHLPETAAENAARRMAEARNALLDWERMSNDVASGAHFNIDELAKMYLERERLGIKFRRAQSQLHEALAVEDRT